MFPQKTYKYKVYSGSEFVGILKNVINEFSYSQEINTAGAELVVELGETLESAGGANETSALIKDDGDNLITDTGDNILISSEFVFDNAPVNLNNTVEIWCYYPEAPEGIMVFDGIITKWRIISQDNKMAVTLVSKGIKMDHQLIQILPDTTIIDNSVTDSEQTLYSPWKTPQNRIVAGAQSFTYGSDTNIRTFSIGLGNSGSFSVPMTVNIYEGNPLSAGSLLGTVSRNVDPGASQLIQFTFSSAVAINAGEEYYFEITNDDFGVGETNSIQLAVNSTSTYANGQAYYYNDSSGWSAQTKDIEFLVLTDSGAVGNIFSSEDPSNILREIISNFSALGGPISYSSTSIDDTNRTVSYTFKFATVYEGVKKCLELAPGNWYFYVDVGTNLIHFHRQGRTPDHKFVLGKHIKELDLEQTLEGLANLVYFSGGDEGAGINVFTTNSNQASILRYGTWLEKMSDNRVTLEDTANILSQSLSLIHI